MDEKILVAEDESPIRMGLEDLLESEGYEVFSAKNGKEALTLYREKNPDLILLDVMMPQLSGYDVAREIRKNDNRSIIVMLTAKGQEVDKVIGLEIGADDYVVKPFGVQELLARIRSHLRRLQGVENTGVENNESLTFGPWNVFSEKLKIQNGEKEIEISMRELELIKMFLANPGVVIPRDKILNVVWGLEYIGTTRTLDQHIAKLRKKIELQNSKSELIRTVHGVGYQYVLDNTKIEEKE